MAAQSWFGSLDLAYKYGIVLGSLFLLVFIAGLIKVLFNRRRLAKFVKKSETQAAAPHEHQETQELNARQMEEGDLFGIRAIQSGYFGGVAQSRPVSPTGSTISNPFQTPSSPSIVPRSPNSSVKDLPLLQVRQLSPTPPQLGMPRGFLLRSESTRVLSPIPRHLSPRPHIRALQPSEAELSGRINHDPVVSLPVDNPPSPLFHSPSLQPQYRQTTPNSPNETTRGRSRPSSPLRPTFPPRSNSRGEMLRSNSKNGSRPSSPLRHYQPSLPADAKSYRAASPLRHYEPTHSPKDTSSSGSSARSNRSRTYDSGSDSPTMGSSISSIGESSASSTGSRTPSPPSSPPYLRPMESPFHFDRDKVNDAHSVTPPQPLRLAPGRETLYYQSAS